MSDIIEDIKEKVIFYEEKANYYWRESERPENPDWQRNDCSNLSRMYMIIAKELQSLLIYKGD